MSAFLRQEPLPDAAASPSSREQWEDVLAAVEADVQRTEALLREPVRVSDAVVTQLAPAETTLPAGGPVLPPLEAMPAVPPELAERIQSLRSRILELQTTLRNELAAIRTGYPTATRTAPVQGVPAAQFVDMRA